MAKPPAPPTALPSHDDVKQALHALYIADGNAGLRREDDKKVREVTSLLHEIARALGQKSRGVLVDAAAGKGYVGLLAAQLLLRDRTGFSVVTLERDPARVQATADLARSFTHDANGARKPGVDVTCVMGDVGDASLWPQAPTLVVALHACGSASDDVIDQAIAARAEKVLLVPCCYGASPLRKRTGLSSEVHGQAAADHWAHTIGVPRHGVVGKRFAQAIVDVERTLRLEAAGYETEVLEFVPPTVTAHPLLWRARRVLEPGRMRDAAARQATLLRVVDETATLLP